MITSLDERTERLFRTGEDPSLPRDVLEKTLQRLDWLDAGLRLHDIATLNGLRFHKYAEADQTDTYVIHVKDTWWIRFRWVHPNCCEVSLFRKR
jgi:plasmid maintenance system killer protein